MIQEMEGVLVMFIVEQYVLYIELFWPSYISLTVEILIHGYEEFQCFEQPESFFSIMSITLNS